MPIAKRMKAKAMSNETASICWAVACLSSWAGLGVSDSQFAEAVNEVCERAKLTPPQEALFKRMARKERCGLKWL